MRSATRYFAAVIIGCASFSNDAPADVLVNLSPVCDTPSAVNQAGMAKALNDEAKIKRLGCILKTPPRLRVRITRCNPAALEAWPKEFAYPIDRDPQLPYSVCEIEANLPGHWQAVLYTRYMNIWPDR